MKVKGQLFDVGNGKKMTVKEIMEKTGKPYITIIKRIDSGITGEDLLADNLRKRVGYTASKIDVGDGKMMSVREIAKAAGIHEQTVYHRMKAGVTGADLLKSQLEQGRKKIRHVK